MTTTTRPAPGLATTGTGAGSRRGAAGSAPGGSQAALAYERLKDRLIMLDIAPGEPVNDLLLAAELGVGRTPVREALKRLETDHLVVSFPRRGTFATVVNVAELGAISDLRRLLEPHAARRAADNATPAAREVMRATAAEVGSLGPDDADRAGLLARDLEVHRLVYAATGNAHLEEVLVRYDNLATRIWCVLIDRLPDLAAHIREHGRLLEAVAAGRADEAAELALEHVTGFERAVRRVL